MNRRLPALIAGVILISACAPTPPERASLPDVEEVLDLPVQCSFLVGDPQGVLVQEVVPDSAAEGVLLAGDVIVSFDDAPTPDSESLLAELADKAAGDMVKIEYLRDDEPATASLTLGANPEDAAQPRIGVMIRTQYQVVEADDVDTAVSPGLFTRPISIGGLIYLLDPTGPTWEQTGIEVSEDVPWVAVGAGIYTITDTTLSDLASGAEVTDDDFDGWEPVRLIGSAGSDVILVVTREMAEDPAQVAVGVSRFDPTAGVTRWVSPVVDGFGIPISALGSPAGESLVLVGVSEGGAEITGVDLWTGEGAAQEIAGMLALGTPVGWLDDDTVLFRTTVDSVTLFSAASGETETVGLEPELEGLPLFPVGDGSRVLAVDDQTLLVDDLTLSDDLRVLAENCSVTRVGEPGWSG